MLTATNTYKLTSGLEICEFFLHINNPNKISLPSLRTKDLIGITIHNTNDLANVEDDAEQYTRATYNGNMGTVRTHFYVDDLRCWQNLEDKYQNWTNGDGSGPGNGQTISIECIMTGENDLVARANCEKLVAHLCQKYNFTTENLYTHTHWLHISDGTTGTRDELNIKPHSYKTCPLYIIPNWSTFINNVKILLNEKTTTKTTLYCVQLGAFSNKQNADDYAKTLDVDITPYVLQGDDKLYRVQLGAFSIEQNARNYCESLKYDAFVTTKVV